MKSIIVLLALMLSRTAFAGEIMPSTNLRIPLLLQFDSGHSGSGFYFDDGSNSAYLVTAKHVLYDGQNLRGDMLHVYMYTTASFELTNRLHALVNLANLNQDGLISVHPTHDVVVCKIGSIQTNSFGEKQVVRSSRYYRTVEKPAGDELSASRDICSLLHEIPIGNEVYIFGYPSSIGIQQAPQIEYEKPLLRRGVVAGKNLRTSTIILDCPVYFGNSGGPVLLVSPEGLGGSSFRIIGVVSQFVPFIDEWKNTKHGYSNINIQNSGYSVVEPMDCVLELCK